MREVFRAYRMTIAIGFRAAPWHATFQLLTGIAMALGAPVLAYGGKLLVDAAVAADLRLGLVATGVLAAGMALVLIAVFYYVDCVFGVIERAQAFADRRLMDLVGGADGLAHHERPDYLDEVQRIREERVALALMTNATAGILRASVSLGATGFLLAQLHPALLLLVLVAAVSVLVGKRSNDLDVAAQEETTEPERLRRHLFEVATAASSGKELRIFGLTDELVRRHHDVSETVVRGRNQATWRGARLQVVDALVFALAYVAAIAFVLYRAVSGLATPGDVVLAIGLASQLTNVVAVGVSYGTAFLWVLKIARRLVWLEDHTRKARLTPVDPAPVPDRLEQGIDIRGVSFGYPDTSRPVLDGLSLHLPAGKVVALVGENGAGKTTLIKLLCGFYQTDEGQVLVDGVALGRFPVAAWRSRVSAAFQDHVAFEFLARETVGVGDLARIDDPAAVTGALERAGATGVLDILPNGLDTQLGKAWEGGVDLSGGQWQRLALGRGLMRPDPLLVVFDEPTAALDAQTEHALFGRFAEAARAGQSRGTVTLLVSHRFSTVRMADLIVVLENGAVLEQGDHAELMAVGGLYAELYTLQSKAYQH
ncbi:ABC transporter ATP-binding protein [Actinopolymorpha alba]|uniref:ABC transporter ATP-binding protein n=1 Tax=Actinopolymorpha alba TaxID=533267 RepID=UPI000370DCC7|nr:ABC transporter ATP-binding protein [Actinopolymorpha alba]